jgi:hypothetical protein
MSGNGDWPANCLSFSAASRYSSGVGRSGSPIVAARDNYTGVDTYKVNRVPNRRLQAGTGAPIRSGIGLGDISDAAPLGQAGPAPDHKRPSGLDLTTWRSRKCPLRHGARRARHCRREISLMIEFDPIACGGTRSICVTTASHQPHHNGCVARLPSPRHGHRDLDAVAVDKVDGHVPKDLQWSKVIGYSPRSLCWSSSLKPC